MARDAGSSARPSVHAADELPACRRSSRRRGRRPRRGLRVAIRGPASTRHSSRSASRSTGRCGPPVTRSTGSHRLVGADHRPHAPATATTGRSPPSGRAPRAPSTAGRATGTARGPRSGTRHPALAHLDGVVVPPHRVLLPGSSTPGPTRRRAGSRSPPPDRIEHVFERANGTPPHRQRVKSRHGRSAACGRDGSDRSSRRVVTGPSTQVPRRSSGGVGVRRGSNSRRRRRRASDHGEHHEHRRRVSRTSAHARWRGR